MKNPIAHRICNLMADLGNVDACQLIGYSRTKQVVETRRFLFGILTVMTAMSHKEIGKMFSGRAACTIAHSNRKLREQMSIYAKTEKDYLWALKSVKDQIKNEGGSVSNRLKLLRESVERTVTEIKVLERMTA